ncbi:Fic/DOC family protein [Cellulomonas carbonis]|uniref:Fic/DOC family protein n=1 Tax=Cellulomonas carbonis TaxID=1386092 RepID=UPI001669B08A|nr:Fic family protein [Cellulomonas carbonis]GGC17984.1 cell filamentation protein Fic [Cellulomonas carbonis]
MPDFVDPYTDPETGLLANLVGARTKVDLDDAEADLSFARLVQLMHRPPRIDDDVLGGLRMIHRRLFQDVYAWAGQVRTVDIRKNVEGAEFFLPVSVIERAAGFAADELRRDRMLQGMARDRFIERLAHHYDQVNYLHPFREGNGRTQRVFWNLVAEQAGWRLDWRGVQGRVNDAACRAASERRDFGPLHVMFDRVVSVAEPVAGDDAWRAVQLARLSFARSATEATRQSPGPGRVADGGGAAPPRPGLDRGGEGRGR